jgi:negative regulator of sigma E activity
MWAWAGPGQLASQAERGSLSTRHWLQAPAWGNPAHPYTIAANVVWAVLFGWQLALAHVTAGMLQALTIIGIGTALTQWQLAAFAM